MSAPVSKRRAHVCITFAVTLYSNQSLYVGLGVRATSVDLGAIFRGS